MITKLDSPSKASRGFPPGCKSARWSRFLTFLLFLGFEPSSLRAPLGYFVTRVMLVNLSLHSGHVFSRSLHLSMQEKQNLWEHPSIVAASIGSGSHMQIQHELSTPRSPSLALRDSSSGSVLRPAGGSLRFAFFAGDVAGEALRLRLFGIASSCLGFPTGGCMAVIGPLWGTQWRGLGSIIIWRTMFRPTIFRPIRYPCVSAGDRPA